MILEETSHHFCHTLLVRSGLLGLVHTQREEIIRRQECQEAGIFGCHVWGCLLLLASLLHLLQPPLTLVMSPDLLVLKDLSVFLHFLCHCLFLATVHFLAWTLIDFVLLIISGLEVILWAITPLHNLFIPAIIVHVHIWALWQDCVLFICGFQLPNTVYIAHSKYFFSFLFSMSDFLVKAREENSGR